MGKEVKRSSRIWKYPSFAWFWDNDRESLLKRIEGGSFKEIMNKNNIELSDVGDWERFDSFYLVILRNGKVVKVTKEGVKK